MSGLFKRVYPLPEATCIEQILPMNNVDPVKRQISSAPRARKYATSHVVIARDSGPPVLEFELLPFVGLRIEIVGRFNPMHPTILCTRWKSVV